MEIALLEKRFDEFISNHAQYYCFEVLKVRLEESSLGNDMKSFFDRMIKIKYNFQQKTGA